MPILLPCRGVRVKSVLWLGLVAVVVGLLCATGGSLRASSAIAAGPCTIGVDAQLDADEQAFLVLINNYRAQNGLGALKTSYMLSKSSAWKSKDLGTNAYFAHDDTPIGRSWFQRSVDCGYDHNTYVGENIAAGYGNAQSVFDGWKASSGHNANMLGSNYTVIGIGKAVVSGSPYGTYWTTVFGGYDDGWAKTGPETVTAIGVITTPDSAVQSIGYAARADASHAGHGGVRVRRLTLAGLCERLRVRGLPAYRQLCRTE